MQVRISERFYKQLTLPETKLLWASAVTSAGMQNDEDCNSVPHLPPLLVSLIPDNEEHVGATSCSSESHLPQTDHLACINMDQPDPHFLERDKLLQSQLFTSIVPEVVLALHGRRNLATYIVRRSLQL